MSYTQLRHNWHRARKEHTCVWCGETIHKGNLYDRVVGVYDGDLQDNCFHPECRLACEEYFRNNPHEDSFELYEQERPKYE